MLHKTRTLAGLTAMTAIPFLFFGPEAMAHPGHDAPGFAAGFGAGFLHPLTGWDHLIAILVVGGLAALRGGWAMLVIPLIFLGLMAAGAQFGQAGWSSGPAEAVILSSLVVLPLLALVIRRVSVALIGAGIALFAVAHGWAHGAEAGAAGASVFMAGALLATALLMGLGVVGVSAIQRRMTATNAA